MSARVVIAAALSARREELTGEASPLDYDGARLVLSCLESNGFAVVQTDDGAAVAAQSMGGSLPPAVPSSLTDCEEDAAETVPGMGEASPTLPGATSSQSPTGPGPAVIGGQPGPDSPVWDATRPTPHAFELVRHRDLSGVSGTGVVAEGCVFTDGSVALRWRGDHPATAVWPDLESVLAVHGHQGATEVRWLSTDVPIDLWPAGDSEETDRG